MVGSTEGSEEIGGEAPVERADRKPTAGGLAERVKRFFAPRPTAPEGDDATGEAATAEAATAGADAADGDIAEHGTVEDESVVASETDEQHDVPSVAEQTAVTVVLPVEPAGHTDDEAAPVRLDDALPDSGTVSVRGLTKSFGDTHAVDHLDLDVHAGSFYGIVGPNGAGKTTTLSMITGLLRPDEGTVTVNGIDVWSDPAAAKRTIGVLPDRLRVFDRLTGAQLLYYAGMLRGLTSGVVRSRVDDLATAFGLQDAMGRLVSDYSAGMVKKVSLAAAMIHSPRVLVLDEPFESVDPVSAARIVEILQSYVGNGGTVVLSSHSMDFIQRVCDHVAIIVEGQVLAAGPVEDVRGPVSLEERFLELAGGRQAAEGMEWLHSFSG
ncbi:ABC transporter ATP-binding protein [Labedella populi]|uniref:ABC transporter ATP-binding protein n=2 Tax=Labedella populi TaxID=2498850 RepID=A0A3S5CM83_9MICO|nr:ABC transporter ATP-binding protein [Labedella populi]